MSDIKKIYKTELEYLKGGIKNGASPYHTFTLSSFNKNYPELRTIVLRSLEFNPLRIYFNADYRSPKVKELENNNSCSALFYDKDRRVQLRFRCKATLHYQNELSKKVWDKTALQSKKCYMGPHSPSEVLDEWHPNIPLEYLKKDPGEKHSEDGYINFTHIELEITETDILQLHHDGHIRFKVDKKDSLFYLAP